MPGLGEIETEPFLPETGLGFQITVVDCFLQHRNQSQIGFDAVKIVPSYWLQSHALTLQELDELLGQESADRIIRRVTAQALGHLVPENCPIEIGRASRRER